jgi:hypothetical protein
MDMSSFAVTLLLVSLPVVGLLALAAWLVERGVGRIRVVDAHGRTLAEAVLGSRPDRD